MKLIVAGKKYPLEDSIGKASLNDLYVLKVKSGMGIKTLTATMQKMKSYEDQLDFLEEAENINALRAIIWLCRRTAGEFIDFEDAASDPLSSIGFEQDEAPAADPKEVPTGSAPDVGQVPVD